MSNIHKITFANSILQECMDSVALPSLKVKKISKMSPLLENLRKTLNKDENKLLIKRNSSKYRILAMGRNVNRQPQQIRNP